jgi:hypothetical protein
MSARLTLSKPAKRVAAMGRRPATAPAPLGASAAISQVAIAATTCKTVRASPTFALRILKLNPAQPETAQDHKPATVWAQAMGLVADFLRAVTLVTLYKAALASPILPLTRLRLSSQSPHRPMARWSAVSRRSQ